MNWRDKSQKLIESSLQKGAGSAEVFCLLGRSTVADVCEGQVETLKVTDDQGVGLRVFLPYGKMGFAHSSDLRESALKKLVQNALATATSVVPDEFFGLPPVQGDGELKAELVDDALSSLSTDRKVEFARSMERSAIEFDPRVKRVRHATYSDHDFSIIIANSNGVFRQFRGTLCTATVVAIAEEGTNAETGWEFDFGIGFSSLNPTKVGREAARRAVMMLGAKPVKSQMVPVVLDPSVACDFVSLVANSVQADQVLKHKSFFAEALEQPVASEVVTLVDDGVFERGLHRVPFDGEGVASQKKVIINRGVLKLFLQNAYTASKMRLPLTGNGVRGSYSSTPEVGPTNFYLAPSKMSQQELLRKCDHGFYVVEAMGVHTANPISGDFSIGASGLWIERGELSSPVSGVTIAGNVKELLKKVVAVGDDLRFFGNEGSPSLLLSEVAVSGH